MLSTGCRSPARRDDGHLFGKFACQRHSCAVAESIRPQQATLAILARNVIPLLTMETLHL